VFEPELQHDAHKSIDDSHPAAKQASMRLRGGGNKSSKVAPHTDVWPSKDALSKAEDVSGLAKDITTFAKDLPAKSVTADLELDFFRLVSSL
jgi:hypothetical protein